MIQICSLGGGVASTDMFLRALHDDNFPSCDAAVFADTGSERQSTLDTIHFLKDYAKQFRVPVHIVRNDKLKSVHENALTPDSKIGDIPFYTLDMKGKKTQLGKYCTKEFKTKLCWKLIRSEYGATYKNPVSVWLGYTVDEATRIKPDLQKYEIRRYPLIEQRIYREHCQAHLDKLGFDFVERSACWCCPYRRDPEYRDMPEHEIQKAIALENAVNKRGMITGEQVAPLRLHPSLIPLSERPFKTDQMDMFDDMCGGGSCFT